MRLEQMHPGIFDDLTVGRVMNWGPDQNDHVKPLAGVTVREARDYFAFSPLMLGWRCDTVMARRRRDSGEVAVIWWRGDGEVAVR